jgi:hypothetical protein
MKVESGLSQSVEQRRAAMPGLASIIDQLREQFGVDFVNQQLATAQAARREYAQVLAQQGAVAAKRWHLANAHRCTFYGEENGREIGMRSPFGNNL